MSATQSSLMTWLRRQWRLTKKEWAETLRDRRTLITLILMPVLVYPLLSIVFRQFLLNSYGKQGEAQLIVAVADEATAKQLTHLLRTGEQVLRDTRLKKMTDVIEPAWVEEPAPERIRIQVGKSELQLKQNVVDMLIDQKLEGDRILWDMQYREGSSSASMLRSFIDRRLRAAELLTQYIAKKPQGNVVKLVHHTPIQMPLTAQSLLPTLVPLILLMMTITGAVYPAIDVTAGERERGTLEALIAAPVSRIDLLLAKYVAVLTVALLTALVNLLAMTFTIHSAGLSETLFGQQGLSLTLISQVLGLLLLFAGFFSAVLLAITSFARSFKEAQAYLIPLMLLTLAPGLMSLSPSLELNSWLAAMPLINVVLLARDLFLGQVDALFCAIVVVSTILYSALAIAVAANVFGSDAILYNNWNASRLRLSGQENVPSYASFGIALVLAFVLTLQLGGSVPQLVAAWGVIAQVIAVGVITLLVFIGIPWCILRYEKIGSAEVMPIHWPRILHWLGAVLLGLSLGVWVMELTLISLQLGFTTFSESLQQTLQKQITAYSQLPLGLLLIIFAIIPAIAEEIFFRGLVLQTISKRMGVWQGILFSAVGFALFHVITPGTLALERLMPSLLMGIVLAVVCWRTQSLLPGMLLHMLNNGLLFSIAYYKQALIDAAFLTHDSQHFPVVWLSVCALLVIIGGCCFLAPALKSKPL